MTTSIGRWIPRLSIGLVAFAIVAALKISGSLQPLENAVAGARSSLLRHDARSDIVVVGIDARSLAVLDSWPWPRRQHAALIHRLQQFAPQQIFLDVDFSSMAPNAQDDSLLVQALSQPHSPRIVLPAFVQPSAGTDADASLTLPLSGLARYATVASANLDVDQDGLVRRLRGSWRGPSGELPTVAARLAGLQAAVPASTLIDFSIAPTSFASISYVDVLAGKAKAEDFRGKTVMIGATAPELGDRIPVPVYRSLPGVVVQALGLQTLRHGGLQPVPLGPYFALLAVWIVAFAALFGVFSWRESLILVPCAVTLIALVSLFVYVRERAVLDVVPFALGLVVAFIASALRSLDEEILRTFAYALNLHKRETLLKGIVDSSRDSILCVGEGGRIEQANPAAALLFGSENVKLAGAPLERFLPALAATAGPRQHWDLESLSGRLSEWDATTQSGDVVPVEVSIGTAGVQGEPLWAVIVRDVREKRAQERELVYRNTHDSLTCLPNRAALDDYLRSSVATAGPGGVVGLLMLGLARVKEVNDTLGHDVGDQVLRSVSSRFLETLGDLGLLARIGDAEFALALPRCGDPAQLVDIAHRLKDSLRAPIAVGGVAMDVGVNAGSAFYPEDAHDVQTLMKHADIAMYAAKKRGSVCERYDVEHDGHSIRKLTMVSEFREAITRGGLDLHYQPQIDLRTGKVSAAEALMRWTHPSLGEVSPSEFVTIAESSDLIRPLTELAFTEALEKVAHWEECGAQIRVAVNLSARMLHDTGFPGRLAALLAMSRCRPAALEIEITESAMMIDPARALRIIREIHSFGVLIAVDDFGTGYSSLGYLRDLPVHALKIDKSFVKGMRERAEDRVIVESTLQMAHALDLKVIAEGVETEWAAKFLAGAGCDFAQGFYFSAARPADELLRWAVAFNNANRRDVAATEPPPPRQRYRRSTSGP